MKFFYPLLFFTCGALAVPTEQPERRTTPSLNAPLENAHIVVLTDDVGDAETFFNSMHLGLPAMTFYNHALKGFAAQLNDATVALLRAHPQVVTVEPDQMHYGQPHEDNAPYGLTYSSYPTKQQNPAKTTDQYYWAYDGTGVTAYIIDSGINADQPQFQGRAMKGPNFVTRQYGPVEEHNNDGAGHGTSVAGCVGSESFGTAKGVKMVGIKVLNANNSGTVAAILAAIDYVNSNCTNKAKCVVNQSTAGPLSSAMNTAIANTVNGGITYVVSAGNQGQDACNYSPGDVAEAITVGAIDQNYERPAFSNYGKCVDLSAAGVGIVTTTAGYPRYPETTTQGTSFSAPYVAGIAAIYLSSTLGGYPQEIRRNFRDYGLHGAISSQNFTGPFASNNLIPTNGYYTGLYTANPVYN